MLKITKDGKTMAVTSGSFKTMYEPFGWAVVEEKQERPAKFKAAQTSDESKKGSSTDKVMKPLSEQGKEELKALAKELGVDMKGITKLSDLRNAIAKKMSAG